MSKTTDDHLKLTRSWAMRAATQGQNAHEPNREPFDSLSSQSSDGGHLGFSSWRPLEQAMKVLSPP
jgi:hypothetical protein